MNGTIITNKGLHLIAKLVATTAPLEFTRAAIGIGQAPSGYDPGGMLDLSDYKMDGVIYSCSATGDEASVVFQVSSIGVDTGFVATEAGLFAEDPDEGEILYAYLDLSEDPQYIYPENSAISKFVEFTLVVKIGLVSRVTAQINPSSLVSKEDFEDKMDEIENPTFDDSGEVEEISSFPDFLGSVVNKMNLFQFFRNLKAGMGYVLHMGKLVNNGLCDTPGQFALDAAYGKNLQDQLTKLNSDKYNFNGQITITSPYDTKVYMISADDDNHCIFTALDKDGHELSKCGYYGSYWGIDGKKILTEK